jgi:hypothetical protein
MHQGDTHVIYQNDILFFRISIETGLCVEGSKEGDVVGILKGKALFPLSGSGQRPGLVCS